MHPHTATHRLRNSLERLFFYERITNEKKENEGIWIGRLWTEALMLATGPLDLGSIARHWLLDGHHLRWVGPFSRTRFFRCDLLREQRRADIEEMRGMRAASMHCNGLIVARGGCASGANIAGYGEVHVYLGRKK